MEVIYQKITSCEDFLQKQWTDVLPQLLSHHLQQVRQIHHVLMVPLRGIAGVQDTVLQQTLTRNGLLLALHDM